MERWEEMKERENFWGGEGKRKIREGRGGEVREERERNKWGELENIRK